MGCLCGIMEYTIWRKAALAPPPIDDKGVYNYVMNMGLGREDGLAPQVRS